MVLNVAMGRVTFWVNWFFYVCLSYSIPERRLIFWNKIIFSPDERFVWVGVLIRCTRQKQLIWIISCSDTGEFVLSDKSLFWFNVSAGALGPIQCPFRCETETVNRHVKWACRAADRWTHPIPKLRIGGVIPPLSPFILMGEEGSNLHLPYISWTRIIVMVGE